MIKAQLEAHEDGHRYIASALDCIAVSHAPVLLLCRKLLMSGQKPSMAMEVYRGATLVMRVPAIGEAARLCTDERGIFRPHPGDRMRPLRRARASPVRFSGPPYVR